MNESELFGKVLHCNLAKPVSLSGKTKPGTVRFRVYHIPSCLTLLGLVSVVAKFVVTLFVVWAEPEYYEKEKEPEEGEKKETETEKREAMKQKITEFIADKVADGKE